jgi:hypothetical protein
VHVTFEEGTRAAWLYQDGELFVLWTKAMAGRPLQESDVKEVGMTNAPGISYVHFDSGLPISKM